MSDSILISTKKALDVPEDYDVFDSSILMHINSVFSTLTQLGIGPAIGYEIEDSIPTWSQYFNGNARLNFIKSYMFLRVRSLFDPAGSRFILSALEAHIKELEWRISVEREFESTLLTAEHKKITGNLGDQYRIRLANPVGKTLINSTGNYSAEFTPHDNTRSGRQILNTTFGDYESELVFADGSSDAKISLDDRQKADGLLFLTLVIKNGTYTVRRVDPRRTILVIEVAAK